MNVETIKKDGCPDGMYPVDSKYPNECSTLEDLISDAEASADILNVPFSWYMTIDSEFGDENKFEVVFVMPRKYMSTWSLYTHDFDPERAVEWVVDFTKRQATIWFGWDE